MNCSLSLNIAYILDARAACFPALQVINRQVGEDNSNDAVNAPIRRSSTVLPRYVIDSSCGDGLMLPSLNGKIEFKNVTFAYPTRKETNVLNGFSMCVEPGATVALVGHRYVSGIFLDVSLHKQC